MFDATGLVVYPGIIDTWTNVGIAARPVAPAGGPGGGLLERVPLSCRMIGDYETNEFRWA